MKGVDLVVAGHSLSRQSKPGGHNVGCPVFLLRVHHLHGALCLLGSEGKVECLRELPAKTSAQTVFFPEQGNQTAPLVGPPGTELIVLLGRRSGPIHSDEVKKLLTPDAPWGGLRGLTVFSLNRTKVAMEQKDRGLGAPKQKIDPVGEVERRLEALRLQLRPQFDVVSGLAFAHEE